MHLAPVVLLGLACAAPATAPHVVRPVRDLPISGSWIWAKRSLNSAGDLQIEEEEWKLEERNGRITGYYERTVTFISSDGRPYRCNGEISITRRTHYRLSGQRVRGRLELRELDYMVEPGPCESGNRTLDSYAGLVRRERLVLSWAGGQQVLLRQITGSVAEPSAPALDGVWQWQQRSVDASGNRRVEVERWTLQRSGDSLRGYYDSTVTFTSGDGTGFACNGEPEYSTHARFEFAGHIAGRRLHIKETGYTVEPGPCEPGLRRLGTYAGTYDRDAVVLSWGRGQQTLLRP